MSSAKQKAKALAKQVKLAMKDVKKAEARVAALGEKMMEALALAKAEVVSAQTIVEYPSGRYECARCKQSVLFTESTKQLPECDNCGSTEYTGHKPKITKIKPPPPKRYLAGMYECGTCSARIAVAEDSNDLPECDFCGQLELKSLS